MDKIELKKNAQAYYSTLDQVYCISQGYETKSKNTLSEVFKINNNSYSYFQEVVKNEIFLFYMDESCTNTLQLAKRSLKDDFVGLYYNLSDENSKMTFKIGPEIINGKDSNCLIINKFLEVELGTDGSEIAVFSIFIKKEFVKRHFEKNKNFPETEAFFSCFSEDNIMKHEIMSIESFQLLKDLQKPYQPRILFDLSAKATVHLLISEYLEKIANESIGRPVVRKKSIAGIMLAQRHIIKNIDKQFPGIDALSDICDMSATDFKKSFKKISGDTAHSFFMDNKLFKAKEFLEESDLTIAEISNTLNFSNPSYFSVIFKKKFGISPKFYRK
ncbi:helix-turn-helix domain-containing protein [Flavobacterium sp. HJSW_4]|uniref:helix-turn-helix domain-containing protein n=1 Tax=Flavobacterium sp. HJSW_4 TaxID=3344660 RepID=UPI0035F451C6